MRRMLAVSTFVLLLAACGADATSDPNAPLDGGDLYRSKGCAACHGSNGQGQAGPALKGAFGSEVRLQDGTTVTFDEAYIRESITDPNAKRAEGFNLPMTTPNLSDAEVDALVAYIAGWE